MNNGMILNGLMNNISQSKLKKYMDNQRFSLNLISVTFKNLSETKENIKKCMFQKQIITLIVQIQSYLNLRKFRDLKLNELPKYIFLCVNIECNRYKIRYMKINISIQ